METVSSKTSFLTERLANLEALLASTTLTSSELAKKLADQQTKTDLFGETINSISGTVGTLQKLSKTDNELLQKYSKVYFLSDNYIPVGLTAIDSKYLSTTTKMLQFHTFALPYLKNMLDKANNDGISLRVQSAYRSFGTQSTLKSSYTVSYGSGSNQFSADQGYSEHQLGTAVDLVNLNPKTSLETSFASTPEYKWLTENAYRFGFILSYPQNNAYYQYEPWHWRFVGIRLATKLHDNNENFADMDQRDINTYLVNIFD
jgi:D-alanyl-D-alanine carboxypeptidase